MGKFDGVLFVVDYDDTLYNTRLEVSPGNHAAIRSFMEQGGRFTIATGRAWTTFTPQIQRENLSFNAPVVLSNGAAIYDYREDRYLVRTSLAEETPQRLLELCQAFPELGFEAYHGEDVYAWNPNVVTRRHLERVDVPCTVCPVEEMPTPWNKVILEQDGPYLQQVQQWFSERWGAEYEVIFSNPFLLEITDRGSNKGTMTAEIARRLRIKPGRIYCMGDNLNDIPMLALSAIPFAPANCAQEVKDWGAMILRHCDEDAVAQAIRILDSIY